MAYSEALADRIRPLVAEVDGLVEKKMFGGLAFLLHGNMSIGIHSDELIVRLDPTEFPDALGETGVRVFEVGGRTMKGWLLVAPSALTGTNLERWVGRGIDYARSLPAK